MYAILRYKVNKVEKYSYLIGEYKLSPTKSLYIYQILSNYTWRFIDNKQNKHLYNSINSVMLYLSQIKEK